MKIKRNLPSLFLLVFYFINLTTLLFAADVSNQFCLRCHSMKTLSYRDSLTNSIVYLYVDSVQFKNSNHGDLSCTDCHSEDGFLQYPHTKKARSQNLYCTDCHESDEFNQFQFTKREQEFKQSVHYQRLKNKFSCFNCHDPHSFKTTMRDIEIKTIVQRDNQICLSCHASKMMLSKLTNELPKDLIIAHNWLPKPKLHWRSVRCIECHTKPSSDLYSHKILPASQAVQNCETCHTKNSILFTKLYRFKVSESRQKSGFFKTLIFNTPYVIGMTRDPLIDKLSIIIFIFLLLAIFTHAFVRWITIRRKRG